MTVFPDIKLMSLISYLETLDNYYRDIKLSRETNSEKFLDSRICGNNDTIITKVHWKVSKPALHWSSITQNQSP